MDLLEFRCNLELNSSLGNIDTQLQDLEEEYQEPEATCIFFGKENDVTISYSYREDISYDPIDVETVDTSISGFYYVTYTNSTFKYKNVVLIRTIQVMEVENNG